MNISTALQILGGVAAGIFFVAAARVTDDDISTHREERLRRHYEKHPRWTDANRWE